MNDHQQQILRLVGIYQSIESALSNAIKSATTDNQQWFITQQLPNIRPWVESPDGRIALQTLIGDITSFSAEGLLTEQSAKAIQTFISDWVAWHYKAK